MFFKHFFLFSQDFILCYFYVTTRKVYICVQSKLSKKKENEAGVAFNWSASLELIGEL